MRKFQAVYNEDSSVLSFNFDIQVSYWDRPRPLYLQSLTFRYFILSMSRPVTLPLCLSVMTWRISGRVGKDPATLMPDKKPLPLYPLARILVGSRAELYVLAKRKVTICAGNRTPVIQFVAIPAYRLQLH